MPHQHTNEEWEKVRELVTYFKKVATVEGRGNVLEDGWEDELNIKIETLLFESRTRTLEALLKEVEGGRFNYSVEGRRAVEDMAQIIKSYIDTK